MSRNFLPLIEFLVEEITKTSGGVSAGQAAMEIMGTTGAVTPTGLSETLATTREFITLGVIDPSSSPLSCGATANALCQIFVGANDLDNVYATVGELRAVASDGKQRLLRIDLSGHSYVIEQVAGTGRPVGNVYRSKVVGPRERCKITRPLPVHNTWLGHPRYSEGVRDGRAGVLHVRAPYDPLPPRTHKL